MYWSTLFFFFFFSLRFVTRRCLPSAVNKRLRSKYHAQTQSVRRIDNDGYRFRAWLCGLRCVVALQYTVHRASSAPGLFIADNCLVANSTSLHVLPDDIVYPCLRTSGEIGEYGAKTAYYASGREGSHCIDLCLHILSVRQLSVAGPKDHDNRRIQRASPPSSSPSCVNGKTTEVSFRL